MGEIKYFFNDLELILKYTHNFLGKEMTRIIIEVENQDSLKEIEDFLKKKNIKIKVLEEKNSTETDDIVGIWSDKYPPEKSSEEIQKEWRTKKWKRF
jgi:hypothetical protein